MPAFPNLGIGGGNLKVSEVDLLIGWDIKLHVVTGLEVDFFRRIHRLQYQLFDESGDIAVADHFQVVDFFFTCTVASAFFHVQPDASAAVLDRVGHQTAADWSTGGGPVFQVEASIVFRTFNHAADHETVGQVGVSVGTDAIRGIKVSICTPVQRVGFPAVVEPDNIEVAQICGRADLQPAIRIRFRFGFHPVFLQFLLGGREFAFHVIRRILDLFEDSGKDFLPCIQQAGIRSGGILFDSCMQFWKTVIRHQREHVMLHVVIHVPVQVPMNRVHVYRAAVQAVIEYVFCEACMLGQTVDHHQPRAKQIGKADKENGKPALGDDRGGNHRNVDSDVNPCPEEHLVKLGFRDKGFLLRSHDTHAVLEHGFYIGDVDGDIEEGQHQCFQVRWTRHCNFRITSHNDCITVVTGMTPSPDGGFPHHHKGGDFIEGVVHPVGFEGGAVAGFMPAGVGGGSVNHGIAQIRNDSPPTAPESDRGCRKTEKQGKPDEGVTDRRAVTSFQQFAHHVAGDRTLVPFRFCETQFNGPGCIFPYQTVIELVRGTHHCSTFVFHQVGHRGVSCFLVKDVIYGKG